MRSGFVAVVGRPNVGKSTLVNALVGAKVAITSPRPQTTRNTVRGVLTTAGAQLVFVDTPGLHRPRTALGERLNRLVAGTLAEADAVVFVLDATQRIGPGDRRIAARLAEAGTAAVVVAVNKVDAVGREAVAAQLAEAAEWDFAAYVPLSALRAENLEPLVDEVVARLPEGPAYFPPGTVTDQPEEFLIAELIREKLLARLREELPHSLAVVVEGVEEQPGGVVRVEARLVVERESQKGMVIGKGGMLLREAGAEARAEIEALLGARVFLELRVRVEKDWQRRPGLITRLGM
ncbi:MAG: GTPase Era [Actinobacteria bacterium]|nr:GTPase Era [Actinomycetota bacterium]